MTFNTITTLTCDRSECGTTVEAGAVLPDEWEIVDVRLANGLPLATSHFCPACVAAFNEFMDGPTRPILDGESLTEDDIKRDPSYFHTVDFHIKDFRP